MPLILSAGKQEGEPLLNSFPETRILKNLWNPKILGKRFTDKIKGFLWESV